MDTLMIPAQSYTKFIAKGKMPDCISNSWKEIWSLKIERAYKYDFEVYDERSKDWNQCNSGYICFNTAIIFYKRLVPSWGFLLSLKGRRSTNKSS